MWRETLAAVLCLGGDTISIHSLRVEGDGSPKTSRAPTTDFNPLPPCGGRLSEISERVKLTLISIHSLRVEGDKKAYVMYQQETALGITSSPHATDFNPLPPCGGRRRFTGYTVHKRTFQSTPSVWRETRYSESLTLSTPFQSTPSVWRETQ